MRNLILLLLLCIPTSLAAVYKPGIEQSYDELFKALMDDPTALHRWSKEQLDQDLESHNPFGWAKAIAIYGTSCMEMGCEDTPYLSSEKLQKALKIAEKSPDQALFIRLNMIIDAVGKDSGAEPTDFRKSLGALKKLAEERGGGRLLADVYRAFAASAESESNLEQALIHAKHALELAEEFGFPGDILPIIIKNDSAILAGRVGDEAQSIALYQQVIDYCARESIRHMGAIAMINLGRIFIRRKKPESVRKGLTYFDQADVVVRQLNEPRLIAFSHLTRGEALLYLQDFASAHQHLDDAMVKFKSLGSSIWVADTLHWKARVFAAQKRWDEALVMINQSDAIFPEHLQNDKALLARERAMALNGMKRYAEAFRSAMTFIELHEKIDEQSKKEQLNQLQVQFGYKIQEQENQLLKKENQIKEHQLREAGLIKKVAVALGLLILLILLLLFFALVQVRKTKQAKARIQYILDNIEEGIVTVGRDLKVESSLSPYLDHVIGHDSPEYSQQNVMLYLLDKSDLKPDEKQLVREIISSCIDEAALVWDLNVGNLPSELRLDNGLRFVSLHWQPLYGKDQKIKRILIAIRDVTMQHRLQEEIGLARAQRGRLQHIMEEISLLPPQRFRQFAQETEKKVQKMRDSGEKLRTFLPELHGLKGEARSLGLKDLASITHQLENLLDARHQPPATDEEIALRLKEWNEVWKDYLSFAQLMEMRHGIVASSSSLLQTLADQWPAIQKHCQEQSIPLYRLTLDEEIFAWTPDVAQAIKDILLHSLINSIDHGFKDPSHRRRPQLDICLRRDAKGMIDLSIRDNGRGLNWDKLEALVKERNFVPEPGQSLADVVFLEGLSTASELSQTSGRGVGLSAIRRIARTLKGDVHIKDRGNQEGCELNIQLSESAS